MAAASESSDTTTTDPATTDLATNAATNAAPPGDVAETQMVLTEPLGERGVAPLPIREAVHAWAGVDGTEGYSAGDGDYLTFAAEDLIEAMLLTSY